MAEWTSISGGGFDYVQTSAPSGAEAGETWLDTSVNPPEKKVYDGTEWSIQASRIRFSLAPESMTSAERQSIIDSDFEGFGKSKTTMENIAGSFTVMDDVTPSQTAMDDISASTIGRSIIIGSPHSIDTLWSKDTGSESWLTGSKTQSNTTIVDGPTSNGKAVELSAEYQVSSNIVWELNLNELSKLEWKDRIPAKNGNFDIKMKIEGETVYKAFDPSQQDSWVKRSVNIDKYGISDVEFTIKGNDSNSAAYIDAQFGDIVLR